LETLIKILGRFIVRDFIYVTGGCLVLACCLYAFGILPKQIEGFIRDFWILSSFLAIPSFVFLWLIGHLCQIIFELIGLAKLEIEGINEKELILALEGAQDTTRDNIERTINLKHIGATLGSCFIVSSIILIITCRFIQYYYGFVVTLLFSIIGALLIRWNRINFKREFVRKNALIKAMKQKVSNPSLNSDRAKRTAG